MTTALVTGGAGFIGSNLIEELVKITDKVMVVDDLSMGLKSNLPVSDKIIFYEKSITDYSFMKRLLLDERPDYVYLLAAVASVADSIDRPLETHEINQNANLFILDTIRVNKLPVKKILFSSSAAVYGDDPTLPKVETTMVRPLTPYAIDKFATERFVIDYGNLYGLNTVCVRFFNVYGPRQNPKSPYSGVLSLISNAIINDKQFTLFGDGSQTRDFVFVGDVVQALLLLMKTPSASHDVYNVATGTASSLADIIQVFEKLTHKKIALKLQPPRSGDIKDSLADISKLSKLGYQPQFDVEHGVAVYLESLK
ncbi:NAD-dependent epimerase/dehydratase family protein [Lapidilactobacillus mulanensis]|uniref:NAD-dependent epimerase/dehydratase family protein n=1 Tax=Lapidilactobacillus mulanensis TaxID=2485999 RepID=A0ABW4DS44_9LACO|nr:NAD-dependent epimerase/dehydratase family protein [Lapidilactobacillus mulanensis]